jgi:hypothetical protein
MCKNNIEDGKIKGIQPLNVNNKEKVRFILRAVTDA